MAVVGPVERDGRGVLSQHCIVTRQLPGFTGISNGVPGNVATFGCELRRSLWLKNSAADLAQPCGGNAVVIPLTWRRDLA